MHALMLSLLTTAALAAPQDATVLCVQEQRPGALASLGVDAHNVIRALRARVGQGHVRVAPCAVTKAATWQLTVGQPSPGQLSLHLIGRDLQFEERFSVAGMLPHQIEQRVALRTAEAVRPAVNARLLELGITPEQPEPEAQALEILEQQAASQPAPEPAPEPTPAVVATPPTPERQALRLELGLSGGPRFALGEGGTFLYSEINAQAGLGAYTAMAHLAFERLSPFRLTTVELRGEQWELGLGAAWEWRRLQIGIFGLARLTALHLQAEPDALRQVEPTYWNGGAGLYLAAWPLQWGPVRAGFEARSTAWWRPRRFLMLGEPVYTQSNIDFFVAPALQVGLPRHIFFEMP